MSGRRNLKTLLVMAVLLVGMAPAIAVGGTIYVDVNTPDNNDGSSWAKACKYLQDALSVAQDGNDIWVAEGSYKPDENTANPGGTGSGAATFQLIDGVGIYGGFPTGGGSWGDRDPNAYETILSGDLDGNDIDVNDPCDLLTEPSRAENSSHVVTSVGVSGLLDGFTITGGNTDETGAGMSNSVGFGGICGPTVRNCTFKRNSAGSNGGGMANNGNADAILSNCAFEGNWSGNMGGGLYNCQNDLVLANCIFIGNVAVVEGGGVSNYGNCRAWVTNCTFIGNSAEFYGGGMSNGWYGGSIVTNCVFSGNSTEVYGGGMSNTSSHAMLKNCTFSGNVAGLGGGIYNDENSSTKLTNCVVWNNSDQIYPAGSAVTYYCCIQDYIGGTGSISDDPNFVDANGPDGILGTTDDNLRLSAGSPCIDSGDSNAVPPDSADLNGNEKTAEPVPFDLDGNPRFVEDPCSADTGNGMPPIVDIGAYEFSDGCGDAGHPYPVMDFNHDCIVNFVDFTFFANHWLECTKPECD